MSDTHAKRIAGPTPVFDQTIETIDGGPYSEALKITDIPEVIVANKQLLGGSEDCIDIVRAGHVLIRDSFLHAGPRTRTFITAKGGGQRLIFSNITMTGRPRWWSISLGDWTIYNHDPSLPPMREVILENCRRSDGTRMIILQLYCDSVVLHRTNARIINLRPFAPLFFRLLRIIRKPDPRASDAHRPWLK